MLSANFSLDEFTISQEAARKGLENIPNAKQQEAIKRLIGRVLQPLRDHLRRPIVISSGFRSAAVNQVVGGARTSQHTRGEAADIYVVGMSTEDLIDVIRSMHLPFDQLIDEFGRWVHVSHSFSGPQRQQVLVARKRGKRTFYTPYGERNQHA